MQKVTLNNLTTQWVKYLVFCTYYGFNPLPVSVDNLCRYTDYLSKCLQAHGSILNYLSGVKTLHILLGESTAAFNDVVFRLAVQGVKEKQQTRASAGSAHHFGQFSQNSCFVRFRRRGGRHILGHFISRFLPAAQEE